MANSEAAGDSEVGMSSKVHLFVERSQPATRFVNPHGARAFWTRRKPQQLIPTDCCRRRRWAKYVRVQVYYDGIRRWCAPGHGCKRGA